MPRQNRVTPFGDLIAVPSRGLVYGNRGCLHDEHGRVRRHHAGKLWIACRLRFRGWHRRPLMQPGRFTELFFLDDATALAAGHRPCALCRRDDYDRFVQAWPHELAAGPRATQINDRLHTERLAAPDAQRRHEAALDDLPDGAFVVGDDGAPWLVAGDRLVRWTPAGYADAVPRPAGTDATVVTPPSTLAVLRRGWVPVAVELLHPSARA